MRYFKVTNEHECHHKFQYQDGLNIDTVPFAMTGSSVPGGLYFTDAENIENHYSSGVWVREVELPINHPKFHMVKDPNYQHWRASCIILNKRVSLFDPAACQALGVPIMSMDSASQRNAIPVLDWWTTQVKKYKVTLQYSCLAVDEASALGFVNVLEWWKNSGLELKYTSDAMDWASSYNHVSVLHWWKHSGLDLKYTNIAIDSASSMGHLSTLIWWKTAGCDNTLVGSSVLKYSVVAMDAASTHNHLLVLKWWKQSGLKLKYTDRAVDGASENGHVAVLNWWRRSELEFRYSSEAIDLASENSHLAVLKWWRSSGLILKYTYQAFQNCQDEVMRWWTKTSGLHLKYPPEDIDDSSWQCMHPDNVLDWFKQSGLVMQVV